MEKKLDNDFISNNKPAIFLTAFVVYALVMILISYFVFRIPIVPICTLVILEALLCACLSKIPLWVHGLVIVAQIVVGVMADKAVFMLLMALVYLGSVALLYLWGREASGQ